MDSTNLLKLSSTYPPAPIIYINNYTNENVKNGMTPPPPPPIIRDNYSCFGKSIDPNDVLIRTLESQGIQRVHSTTDHKKELKKLNHSILMNYLDLLAILVKSPNTLGKSGRTLREEKLEEIELLFINMHHLINELRPHQARDNLKSIMEIQKCQRIEIRTKFEKHLNRITDLLRASIESIRPSESMPVDLDNCLGELNLLIEKSSRILKINSAERQTSIVINDNTTRQPNDVNETFDKDKILCDIVDEFLNNSLE